MIFGLYTRKEMEREFERRAYEERRFINIGENLERNRREIEEVRRDLFDLRCRVDPQMKQTPIGSCCCKEG